MISIYIANKKLLKVLILTKKKDIIKLKQSKKGENIDIKVSTIIKDKPGIIIHTTIKDLKL